ncbi:hypothetical protein Tco_0715376 [Tanacetum coccineum]|uniref:Uncharacterized protein n=1 Tax=Tanacetum coccineum TaxID=301880 RepID=A0ABQ5C395_9ASTR
MARDAIRDLRHVTARKAAVTPWFNHCLKLGSSDGWWWSQMMGQLVGGEYDGCRNGSEWASTGDDTGSGGDTGSDGDGIRGSGGEGIWESGDDHRESGDDGGVDIARSDNPLQSDHTGVGLRAGK